MILLPEDDVENMPITKLSPTSVTYKVVELAHVTQTLMKLKVRITFYWSFQK